MSDAFVEKRYIEEYTINNKYQFTGADVFSYQDRNLLLNSRLRTSILIDDFCLRQIENNHIGDDLMFKLHQRDLIRNKNECVSRKESPVRPKFFLINLTNNCNLRCRYCFRQIETSGIDKIGETMLQKICDYILQYCRNYNIREFSIQFWGGEPLLLFDKIKAVQEFFWEHHFNPRFILETNGTLIDREIAEELTKRKIRIGISIDGPEYLHNLQRPFISGVGSHQRILQGHDSLKAAGYNDYGIITVITKKNIGKASEILDYFARELNLHQVKFNIIKKNSFSPESFELSNISDHEIDNLFETLIEKIIHLNRDGYRIYERNICDKMINLLSRRNRNICSSRGCMGGYKIISFDGNGDVYPCDMLDNKEVRIGNIAEDSDLVHMIESSAVKNSFFREKEKKDCSDCPWNGYCRGGCTASAVYSKECSVDERECRVNKILYPKLIRVLMEDPKAVPYLTNNEVNIL